MDLIIFLLKALGSLFDESKPEIRNSFAVRNQFQPLRAGIVPDLDELLEKNAERISELRAQFANYVLNTKPADRELLEHTINSLYRSAGMPLPQIVWFDSPFDLAVAAMVLRNMFAPLPPQGACLSAGAYGPPPELFGNRYTSMSAFGLFLQGQVQSQPRRPFFDELVFTFERALRIQGANSLRRNLERLVEDEITISGDELTQRYSILPLATSSSMCPDRIATVLDRFRPHVPRDQMQFHNLEDRLLDNKPFWMSFYDHPWWLVDHAIHLPQLDAFSSLQKKVSQLIGFEEAHDDLYIQALEAGGWWVPYPNICAACDNIPLIKTNDQFFLHSEDGPAIVFDEDVPGGWALNGVLVPERVVKREFLGMHIDAERNVEIRRVMLERYGLDNYISETGAEQIQRDKYGTLYRKNLNNDEALMLVKVKNQTPEPDGTYRNYFLRVPPQTRTAKQAVAWTFGLETQEYEPCVET